MAARSAGEGNRFAELVYDLVCQIPMGQVASYAQVATYLGAPGAARAVGNALRNLTTAAAKVVPWHRVIRADGTVAVRGDPRRPPLQVRLLKAEGVVVDRLCRVSMDAFGWRGPERLPEPVATPVPGDSRPRRRRRGTAGRGPRRGAG